MHSLSLFLALRLLHLLAGAAWVGGIFFIARLLLPTVRALGPTGGAVMQHLTQVRRLHSYMMGTAMLTVLSGLALYWRNAAGASGWLATGAGKVFGLGGLLGILTVILGLAVNAPTAQRAGALAGTLQSAGRAPTPEEQAELGRLQARLTGGANVAAILLAVATAAMALARYVP
jgi:uncharacterized membrane protein